MSEPNSLTDIFESANGEIPEKIPSDPADLRMDIGTMLGFVPENPDGEFRTVELAEIYAALIDAGYEVDDA